MTRPYQTRSNHARAEAAWLHLNTDLRPGQIQALYDVKSSGSIYQWAEALQAGKYGTPAVPYGRQEELREQARRILNPSDTRGEPVADEPTPDAPPEPSGAVAVIEPSQPPAMTNGTGTVVHATEIVDLAEERRQMYDRIEALAREEARVRQEAAVAEERHKATLAAKDVELDLLRGEVTSARRTIDHQKRDIRTLSNALVVVQLAPTD